MVLKKVKRKDKEYLITSNYQRIGDIIIIPTDDKKIAENFFELYPKTRMVCTIDDISGELRQPKIKIVKSNDSNTETIHKENGIKYKLDISKVMFSKGNLSERKRLVDQVTSKETIIDMFAGIGYFSLPLSIKAKKIYAIEKNKDSFHYLKENISLNNIKNIEPILSDNRDKSIINRIHNKADRVLMGYFSKENNTKNFLETAMNYVKKGGIIHYHNVYRMDDLWDKPIQDIKSVGNIEIINKKKVKSVGPRLYHVVIDFKVL